MKIPVFVSCSTSLSSNQESCRRLVMRELERHSLEPRTLGRSDYPTELPLREVYLLAKHCSGGVILGFEQFRSDGGLWKRGTPEQKRVTSSARFPTPWNHLETGILYSLGLPLLVFAEEGIAGGIFDRGVTDVFVHKMPTQKMALRSKRALRAVFQKWQASVRAQYYKSDYAP